MTTALRLASLPSRPPHPSKLHDKCEELHLDTLTARRLLRWRLELPLVDRDSLDAAVSLERP